MEFGLTDHDDSEDDWEEPIGPDEVADVGEVDVSDQDDASIKSLGDSVGSGDDNPHKRPWWDNGEEAPSSLRQNDKKRPYYNENQIKHLSSLQMFASQNWHLDRMGFQKHWGAERKAYAEREKVRKDKKEHKKSTKEQKKAKKQADRAEKAEKDRAHHLDGLGFAQFMRQNTIKEQLEAAGKGGFYVFPNDKVNPTKFTIVYEPDPRMRIKIGGTKLAEANEILEAWSSPKRRRFN